MTHRRRRLAPLPLLTAFASGLATLAGPRAALADPPIITIVSPASGAILLSSNLLPVDASSLDDNPSAAPSRWSIASRSSPPSPLS